MIRFDINTDPFDIDFDRKTDRKRGEKGATSECFKDFGAEITFIYLSERKNTSSSALGNKPERRLDLLSVSWYGASQISISATCNAMSGSL